MSTTITGKLNDNAREFQAGESTGFGFRLGVQYYCRTDKEKKWTNYEGALFSNNQNQIDFLRGNLVAGSVITVSAKTIQIKQFQGDTDLKLTIGLNDCNLDFSFNPNGGQSSAPQSSAPQAPQAPQAKDFSKEIAAYWAMPSDQARQAHWGRLNDDVRQAIMDANG